MGEAESDGGIIIIPTIHHDNSARNGIRVGGLVFKNGRKFFSLGHNLLREFRR